MNSVNILFPTNCLLCDLCCDPTDFICKSCHDTLPHDEMSDTLPPPPVDRVMALFEYEPPISSLLHQLKFSGNLLIARWLATQWINHLKKINNLPELILPVPLHHARLSARGFNQALEIAKPIGKYFNIPVDTQSCIRIKNTQAQSSLTASKRKHNLKNAFGLSRSISAKHIAILDDVMTTGNTISEIAYLLRKIGVEKIDVWCCARTITTKLT